MILEHLPYLANKSVVLASASPRRLQLLQLAGMGPRVVTSTFEETLPKADFRNGAEYAVATSRGKALEVAGRLARGKEHADLIIGADTVCKFLHQSFHPFGLFRMTEWCCWCSAQVVEIAHDILEKPANAQHAADMLSR